MLPAAAIVSINGTERSNMAVADDFTLAYAAAAYPSALDECKGIHRQGHCRSIHGHVELLAGRLGAGGEYGTRVVGIPCSQNRRAVHRPEHVGLPNHRSDQAAAVAGHHRDQGDGAGLGTWAGGQGKETTRTFATDAQRLCFTYDAKYIEYDKYLISVSNRNGVADNKFLLVSAADGSETVPYTLSFTGAARRWRCPVSMDCR